jgi:FixJ family two-component response regulator
VYKARMMEKLQCRSVAEVVRTAIAGARDGPAET